MCEVEGSFFLLVLAGESWLRASRRVALTSCVRLPQVNADEHKELAGQYGVKGFPTIKVFMADKKKPRDYNGGRTAGALAEFAVKSLGEQVMGKLGVKQGGSGSSGGGGGSKGGGSKGGPSGPSPVVNLNEADFNSKVLASSDDWLIAFTAPWCGHCVKLKPEWDDAAKQLKGDFKLGWVDATQESALGQKYQVQGYPTIKMFSLKDGKKVASDYNGARDAAGIVNYLQAHIESTGTAKPITEITSASVFSDECSEDWSGICVVAFLPNILDDQVVLHFVFLFRSVVVLLCPPPPPPSSSSALSLLRSPAHSPACSPHHSLTHSAFFALRRCW